MSAPFSGHRSSLSAHLGLLFVQVCFATFPIAGKFALRDFAPLSIATWRVLVGAIVLWVLARLRHPSEIRLTRADMFLVFWLGLLGIALNQMLYITGLSKTTAIHAVLMMGTAPVLTYVFAALLGREPWLGRKVIGVTSALLGVVVLFVAQGGELTREHLTGDLLVFVNAAFYSLYLVLAKPLLARKPPLVVIAWVFLAGALIVPLLSLHQPWWPEEASSESWWSLVWILVFPTVLAYLVNLWSLVRVEASIVAIYICMQPILSLVLAAAFLGEKITAGVLATLLLVLHGVYWVSRKPRTLNTKSRA